MRSLSRLFVILFAAPVLLWALTSTTVAAQQTLPLPTALPLPTPATAPATTPIIAQIHFQSYAALQALTTQVDVWEVQHSQTPGQGYVVALLPAAQQAALRAQGYRLVVDASRSALLAWQPARSAQQSAGIPGFPCYRTVEETYTALAQLATAHPTLAQWQDIGDSWDKVTPADAAGYDLMALVLTNRARPGPKPVFLLIAAIHAREFTTAEVATRFGEYLIENYGTDGDITHLLDTTEIHIVPQANPDGRKRAEGVVYWRKNTNRNSCTNENPFFSYYGIDLNRNSSFKWGACEGSGCSTAQGCLDTYRGSVPASEPETQALESYMRTIFADQRGELDTDAAPTDASGLLISLHSYGGQVLFPWGWRPIPSPNHSALETLGRKFGYFTGYEVCQAGEPGCIYQTDGTTDDWAYGELGIAAYTFELGTAFFEQCTYFEEEIIDDEIAALLYAAKVAGQPYQLPAGPETLDITMTLITNTVALSVANALPAAGAQPLLRIRATANDTRYASKGWGIEASQVISAARLTLTGPLPLTTTLVYTMTAVDGQFDSNVETVEQLLPLPTDPTVTYQARIESQDANGQWGAATAALIVQPPPTDEPPTEEPRRNTVYLPLIAQ